MNQPQDNTVTHQRIILITTSSSFPPTLFTKNTNGRLFLDTCKTFGVSLLDRRISKINVLWTCHTAHMFTQVYGNIITIICYIITIICYYTGQLRFPYLSTRVACTLETRNHAERRNAYSNFHTKLRHKTTDTCANISTERTNIYYYSGGINTHREHLPQQWHDQWHHSGRTHTQITTYHSGDMINDVIQVGPVSGVCFNNAAQSFLCHHINTRMEGTVFVGEWMCVCVCVCVFITIV